MARSLLGLHTMLVAAVACLAAGGAVAQSAHPDFTGLWTNYRSGAAAPGRGFNAGPQPSYNPEARAKVEAKRAAMAAMSAEVTGATSLTQQAQRENHGARCWPFDLRDERLNRRVAQADSFPPRPERTWRYPAHGKEDTTR